MGKNTQPKETRNSTVLKEKVVREFSAGGIVFKNHKWLIRSTAPSDLYPKTYWTLPKGWIDNDKPDVPGPMASGMVKADEVSLQKTAIREVAEETGVKAKIVRKVGTESFFYTNPTRGNVLKFVTFYLMEYVKDLPEGHDQETSEVVWLSFSEAYKKLSFGGEKQMLTKAQELL